MLQTAKNLTHLLHKSQFREQQNSKTPSRVVGFFFQTTYTYVIWILKCHTTWLKCDTVPFLNLGDATEAKYWRRKSFLNVAPLSVNNEAENCMATSQWLIHFVGHAYHGKAQPDEVEPAATITYSVL